MINTRKRNCVNIDKLVDTFIEQEKQYLEKYNNNSKYYDFTLKVFIYQIIEAKVKEESIMKLRCMWTMLYCEHTSNDSKNFKVIFNDRCLFYLYDDIFVEKISKFFKKYIKLLKQEELF